MVTKTKAKWPPGRVYIVTDDRHRDLYMGETNVGDARTQLKLGRSAGHRVSLHEYRLVPKREPVNRPARKPTPLLPRGVALNTESLKRFAEHAKAAGRKVGKPAKKLKGARRAR